MKIFCQVVQEPVKIVEILFAIYVPRIVWKRENSRREAKEGQRYSERERERENKARQKN